MTKAVSYKQSNRLTQGVYQQFLILRLFSLGVPRTFGQDYGCIPVPYSDMGASLNIAFC